MPIKPGTLSDFSGSMAEQIEIELNLMLTAASLPKLPDTFPHINDHRRLFVAIARGVVRHLKANAASIEVRYNDDGITETASTTLSVTGL